MPITLNGSTGITTPTYNGNTTAEYLVPVTSFKNRIINGNMVIDQRNNGAAVTFSNASFVYPVDRWFGFEDTDGVMTGQRSTVAPEGFTNSVLCTTTTADSSLAATQRVLFEQRIEGFNIADLGWGTANAKTVTLSFWVRSSLTGTFGGALKNSATRSYAFTYTISNANTFEFKTVTIPGDTSGTWTTNNSTGISVCFGLGVGSTFSTTAGSWAAGDFNSATGAVSVIGTLNATWYLTGVQLEVGSTATSFDYRPYGTELQLCQRYFQISGSGVGWPLSSTSSTILLSLFCPMRAQYTGTVLNGTNTFLDPGVAQRNITAISSIESAIGDPTFGVKMDITNASTTTGKTAITLAGAFGFSAEL